MDFYGGRLKIMKERFKHGRSKGEVPSPEPPEMELIYEDYKPISFIKSEINRRNALWIFLPFLLLLPLLHSCFLNKDSQKRYRR